MYLHIGKNMVLREADIIGILDLDNSSQSRITRDYLAKAEKSGIVVNVADDLPKSVVICDDRIYLSQLASSTLLRRTSENLQSFIEKYQSPDSSSREGKEYTQYV
jgi:hypothetical protein